MLLELFTKSINIYKLNYYYFLVCILIGYVIWVNDDTLDTML